MGDAATTTTTAARARNTATTRAATPGAADDPRLAAAAWSRLAEPGDTAAGALVALLGAGPALAWVTRAARDPDAARAAITDLVAARGDVGLSPAGLLRAVSRWAPRVAALDPARDLRALARIGGRLVVAGGPGWPAALDDLGAAAPRCLWVRGDADLSAMPRTVALVGARACTDYGRHVTAELAHGLAQRGFAVVSGGAYGIDAAAHTATLAADGVTVAFLAGGVDRLYPAGNATLLREIVDRGGVVACELPPGAVPSRVRFLLRNRLIAASSRATVVVEAAWRSGALSTATHAAGLLRPVGAVPGPVTSMASSGCHRLLRDGAAVCVTDADEVAELAGDLGLDTVRGSAGAVARTDELDAVGRRLFDALPLRREATADDIARAAGLAFDETLGGLGLLEAAGFAQRVGAGWRRTS